MLLLYKVLCEDKEAERILRNSKKVPEEGTSD